MITLDWTECRPPILLAVYFLSFAPLLVRGRHSQLPARLGERRSLGERERKPETRDVGNGSERQGAYEKAARPANIPYILFMVLQCLDKTVVFY